MEPTVLADSRSKQRWLNRVPELMHQRRLSELEQFEDFGKTKVEVLLSEALKATSRGRPPEALEDLLVEYYNHMVKKGYAQTSAKTKYHIVRGFFSINNVKPAPLPRNLTVTGSSYEPGQLLTQEQVKAMVKMQEDPQDKASVAFLASTGQRKGVILGLRWDIIRLVDGYGLVEVPPTLESPDGYNVNKGRNRYKFVIIPSTMKLLKALPSLPLGYVFNTSWHQIIRAVESAADKLKIQRKIPGRVGRNWHSVHPHIFRRYWKNQMRESKAMAGMAPDEARIFLDFNMGHIVPYTGAYDTFTDEKLIAAYKRAEEQLSVV